MAGEIGKIISLNGSFFIKHPNGSVSTAKVNDILNDGDIIIGSSSNTNSNMLKVLLSDNSGDIQVVGNNEQLFDVTLLSGELPEDTVVQNNEVSDLLEQSTKNIQENPAQTDEQATLTLDQIEKLDAAAAGEDQTTTDPIGIIPLRLEDRTAGETNITTDLRDAVSTTTIVDDTVATNNTILVDATLTLTDTTILEGNENATVSASLDQTPRTTLIVTLSNGATITFGTDYVPGTLVESTSFPIQGDDVYIDAEAYTVSGTSYVGGGFNSIVGYPSTVTISDTNDTVTATLTSSLATGSNEDVGSITYTITLTNADELPVAPTAVAGETFSFTLNDGTEVSVVVPQNRTTGSTTLSWSASASDFTALADADVFSNTTTVSLNGTITSTNNSGYENLVTAGTSSHTVVDSEDTTILKVNESLNSDGSYTYTAVVSNAPDTGNNLVITLDNGKTIILDSSVITASVNSDTQALSVTSVTGGNYEDLKVVYGFGQDIIMKIAANNSLDDVDTNTSYFDSDTINTEIALSSIKLTPQVDVRGNELSLLFNVNDLYVLASATSDTGVAGSGNNAYQVNYSTGNGLGVDDAGTIGTDEKLYLNFTNSTMSSNLLLGGNGNDTDGNDNTITDSVDNRTYALNNEQYLTNAIFSLQKWQSGDQAIWQAFNGTVLIAEGTKDYVANDSTLAVSSEVSNINITTSGITWSMYDNVLTNDSGSAQTADVSYTINEGTTSLSTIITLDAGESFNFNAFNEIQFTAGSGDYSLSSMSASNTESIPPENQVINVGIDTYINGTEHSSGVMQITFDGDGAIVGTSESEVIDYTDVTSIDGGDGIDTLVLSGNESIDFSSIPDNSIVSLLNTTESWTKASSTYTDVDSIVYDVFSNNEDSSYKVLIQQNVQDTITNS